MVKTEEKTYLYRWFDINDSLLYVGITNNPKQRTSSHTKQHKFFRENEIAKTTWQSFENRETALIAEENAIKTERPKYNIVHNYTTKSYVNVLESETIEDYFENLKSKGDFFKDIFDNKFEVKDLKKYSNPYIEHFFEVIVDPFVNDKHFKYIYPSFCENFCESLIFFKKFDISHCTIHEKTKIIELALFYYNSDKGIGFRRWKRPDIAEFIINVFCQFELKDLYNVIDIIKKQVWTHETYNIFLDSFCKHDGITFIDTYSEKQKIIIDQKFIDTFSINSDMEFLFYFNMFRKKLETHLEEVDYLKFSIECFFNVAKKDIEKKIEILNFLGEEFFRKGFAKYLIPQVISLCFSDVLNEGFSEKYKIRYFEQYINLLKGVSNEISVAS